MGLKAVQLGSVLAWCEWGLLPVCGAAATLNDRWAVVEALRSAAPARWMFGLALLIPGQALNIGIYKAIGADGVYYGFKLGQPVPWATGFPFNLGLRHPQYVGAMLAWTGILSLGAVSRQAAVPLGALLGIWGCFYSITAQIEQRGDNN